MKKLSILLIGLLLVSGLAFAQDVTVTGSATLTFGMDLNNNATGFQNEAASSISLEWLSGDEESGTQGWITLSGWEISLDHAERLGDLVRERRRRHGRGPVRGSGLDVRPRDGHHLVGPELCGGQRGRIRLQR